MRRTDDQVPRPVVTLRPATLDDARVVFDWRNDSDAQANSFSTEEFSFDHHVNWMKPRLDEFHPESIYIAEVKGQSTGKLWPIGYGRVKFTISTGMISLVVSRAFRSKGYGQQIIKGLTDITTHAGRVPLATIKKDNVASRRAFEAVGFVVHHRPKAREMVMYYSK
jgi:RimJ/RimL family protein N-acetyltransferase